jgi:hypothetical protein
LVATGLPVPRLAGWASAIAGDLVWFALLLGTSIAAASIADDDRFIGIVVLVAMIAIPQIAKRLFPALRDDGARPGSNVRPAPRSRNVGSS